MDRILVVLLLAACASKQSNGGSGSDSVAGSATASVTGSARSRADSALAMTDVRLLEPESVLAQRVPDVAAFAAHLQSVTKSIAAFDAAHPGALPSRVDVAVVTRATGTRVWLVGPAGDLAAAGLDAEIAKLPRLPIKARHVAVIITMVRSGTSPKVSDDAIPLPSAWKDAAGIEGTDIDTVIDKVWPSDGS